MATSASYDYEHADKGPALIAITLGLFFVATAPFVLRIYTRLSTRPRTYGTDDTLLVGAWVMMLLWVACMLQSIRYGAGRHVAVLTDAQLARATEPRYFGSLANVASLGLVKCSMVVQALRIFVGKRTRAALWVTLVVIALYSFFYFVASLLTCIPISAAWEMDVWNLPAGSSVRCIDFVHMYYSYTALNILADIAVLAVPLPALLGLNLPVRAKVAACILVSLGSFGCVTSAVRLYELWWTFSFERDSTWAQGANVWTSVELTTFVTCASATGLKPLLDRMLLRAPPRGCLPGGAATGAGSAPSTSHGSRSPWVLPSTRPRRSRREPGALPLPGDAAGPWGDLPRAKLSGAGAQVEENEEMGGAAAGEDDEEAALRARPPQRHSWHGFRRGSLIPLREMVRGLPRTDLDVSAGQATEGDVAWNGLRQHPC